MSKTEENRLTVTISNFYESSIYTKQKCAQTKIMIRAKPTYPLPPSTPVSLIAGNLLSL